MLAKCTAMRARWRGQGKDRSRLPNGLLASSPGQNMRPNSILSSRFTSLGYLKNSYSPSSREQHGATTYFVCDLWTRRLEAIMSLSARAPVCLCVCFFQRMSSSQLLHHWLLAGKRYDISGPSKCERRRHSLIYQAHLGSLIVAFVA